jgi:hypothetical protein
VKRNTKNVAKTTSSPPRLKATTKREQRNVKKSDLDLVFSYIVFLCLAFITK